MVFQQSACSVDVIAGKCDILISANWLLLRLVSTDLSRLLEVIISAIYAKSHAQSCRNVKAYSPPFSLSIRRLTIQL